MTLLDAPFPPGNRFLTAFREIAPSPISTWASRDSEALATYYSPSGRRLARDIVILASLSTRGGACQWSRGEDAATNSHEGLRSDSLRSDARGELPSHGAQRGHGFRTQGPNARKHRSLILAGATCCVAPNRPYLRFEPLAVAAARASCLFLRPKHARCETDFRVGFRLNCCLATFPRLASILYTGRSLLGFGCVSR